MIDRSFCGVHMRGQRFDFKAACAPGRNEKRKHAVEHLHQQLCVISGGLAILNALFHLGNEFIDIVGAHLLQLREVFVLQEDAESRGDRRELRFSKRIGQLGLHQPAQRRLDAYAIAVVEHVGLEVLL